MTANIVPLRDRCHQRENRALGSQAASPAPAAPARDRAPATLHPSLRLGPPPRYFVLVDREPVAVADSAAWSRHFEAHREAWRVAHARVGQVSVSTVFLGVAPGGDAPPRLFETLILGCPGWHGFNERCATWDEAVAQHEVTVEAVRATQAAAP